MVPVAVSADGSTIVGYSASIEAFRWTLATGMVVLPRLAGATSCTVSDVDANGAHSVGWCTVASGQVPVRWTGTSAPNNLGIPSGFQQGSATSLSANGTIITGRVIGSATHGAIWTIGANPTFFANAASVAAGSGNAINADGTVIVGLAQLSSGGTQAFRWTQATGMQLLPYLMGTTFSSQGATGVSGNGARVVGTSGNRPFLWNSGVLTAVGTATANGRAISSDGTTLLTGGFNGVALTTVGGTTQLLSTQLAALGVDLGGWVLNDGFDLSANGKVVIGVGLRDNTSDEGWIAVLP